VRTASIVVEKGVKANRSGIFVTKGEPIEEIAARYGGNVGRKKREEKRKELT